MLRCCVLLLMVCVVAGVCQSHTVRTACQITCNTDPAHLGPKTPSWSERHTSRYNTYRPLNTYLSQYGSNVRRANQTVYAPNIYRQNGSITTTREQHTLGQHFSHHSGLSRNSDRRQEEETAYSTSARHQTTPDLRPQAQQRRQGGNLAYSTSHRHQTSSHHIPGIQQRRPNTHTSSFPAVPPLIESSTGFTHYNTLRRHGPESRRVGHDRARRPDDSSSGRGKGYRGRHRQHLPGEGYGEAYLRWSEYGVGETKR